MKFKNIAIIALTGIALSACSDAWLEEYKLDQNRPSDVTMEVLLPSAQVNYGITQGDVLPRLTSIFMQQMTGTDRQSLAHNTYSVIGEGDFNTPWNNSYAGGLYDLNIIITKAEELGAPAYAGIAKITTAMYLGLLTDHFGDIPFEEAFQGATDLTAKFDSQESIYAAIQTLLDDGKANLLEPSNLAPSGDDLIHGGDLIAWGSTADALKARYLNHLSKTSLYDADAVIAACDDALAGSSYAALGFDASLNQNPWWQFLNERQGYITQFGTMYDMMEANVDPRIAFYRSADSTDMPFFAAATAPLAIVTPFETMFIKAEALIRKGDAAAARLVLEDAVESNMMWLGVDPSDIASYVAAMSATTDLELIMTEKYYAMFTSSEVWTDWRRTGFPALTAPSGAILSDIPRRLPYPENEYLYNSANVPMPIDASPDEKFGVSGSYKLWWDM